MLSFLLQRWPVGPKKKILSGWAKIDFQTTSYISPNVSYTNTYYYGLQGFYGNDFTAFTDSSCSTTGCKDCAKAGKAALGLLVLTFFMTLAVTITSFLRARMDSSNYKFTSVFLSIIIWFFSVSAYGTYNDKCYSHLTKVSGAHTVHGAGFNIAVVGWFFMWIVLTLHILLPVQTGQFDSSGGQGNSGAQAEEDAMYGAKPV